MVSLLIQVLIYGSMFAIISIPFAVAMFPVLVLEDPIQKMGALIFCPLIFLIAYFFTAAAISFPFQKLIVRGVFPRRLDNIVYIGRRFWGAAWAMVAVNIPVYHLVLSIAPLQTIIFRVFGYRGKSTDFRAYTDTWIRDLGVLDFGKGAYLGNLATIGTNICLTDGNILVDRITIGDGSHIGRLCIVGPGVWIHNQCETGVRTTLGIRARVFDNVKIQGETAISHGCKLHKNVVVGESCYLGQKVEIHENIRIPHSSIIPQGKIFLSQNELDDFFTEEKVALKGLLSERLSLMANFGISSQG